MKMRRDHIRFFAITFSAILLLWSCSPSHVLHQTQEEKQVFTYIDFQRNHKTYTFSDTIVIETAKTIKILGFAGDKYLVELSPSKETLSLQVEGTGFDIRRCTDHMHTVLVRERESIFSITVKGPANADYNLKITRM